MAKVGGERLGGLEGAMVRALAYADVFDFPLTAAEVHRDLVGVETSLAEVEAALAGGRLPANVVTRRGEFYALAGRDRVVELRAARAATARRLWRVARRYGRWLAALPFVRMVAVTGGLAAENVEADADIDLLVVTEPERVWLCRAMAGGLRRLAALREARLCPNYFLSERALVLEDRSLYVAHELLHLVPLAGSGTYTAMLEANAWVRDWLPNAYSLRMADGGLGIAEGRPVGLTAAWGGRLMRGRLGDWLERRERARKQAKLRGEGRDRGEASYTAEHYKGHFQGHGQRVLAAYAERLERLGQAVEAAP